MSESPKSRTVARDAGREGTAPRATAREVTWRIRQQLPLLLALVVLWMALWGEISLFALFTGVLVAVGVTRVFYLPPVELSGRFNPFWFVVLMLSFVGQLAVASAIVSAQAFAPGRLPLNAIIEIPLRTRSDFVMTTTATLISLIPGTIVLEIDRDRARLFLHVLAARDRRGVERARASALAIEYAVVRAIGSRAELDALRRRRAKRGGRR